jgi:hypothetical protein
MTTTLLIVGWLAMIAASYRGAVWVLHKTGNL